jgi:hypothetical protein
MVRRSVFGRVLALALLVGVAGVAVQGAEVLPANAAFASQLTRYPYLTDVTQGYATVNWATDTSGAKGSITYGKVGSELCTAHKVSGSKTSIAVKGVSEYQWKAKISGLQANSQYCYRVFLGTTDLLTAATPAPVFYSQIPAGNTTPYSFAVFGDWGDTDANGDNPAQTALMTSMASSGVRFALGTGDTAYDGGTQGNYGDLNQTGYRVSSIFGPNYWAKAGSTVPLFNVPGNHGGNATFFTNWPQDRVVSASSGKYAMETYCCANGASSQKSPSAWYAFDAGVARIYVLTAMWSDSNTGTSTDYGMDYAYRWQQSSPEYKWLQNDLQTHSSQLKFAVFHYPLYSDNATEPSDTFLQGANSLEGLLEQNGVNMVFNGHAHLYQHNAAPPGGVVSYVSGGGGATPEPITKCKALDTYGLGWSATGGGSSCGTAVKPTDINQVYHYLKVDVNGTQVTVSGVNALGQTFDSTMYDFAADNTPPTAPSNLQATAPAGNRVDLTWGASSDPKGIAAYDIYRDGGASPIATVNGSTTAYSDTTVSQQTQYSYVVTARDPSNNTSDPSNTALVTTPSLDQAPPNPPTNLAAVAPSSTRVDLTWTAATDDVGVTGYDIFRGGSKIGSAGANATAYSDTTVASSTQYSYTVQARDAAGNSSVDSNVATVTTPSAGVLFADDFESGSLSAWTTVSGLAVTQGVPAPSGGSWVARETASGAGATYAYKSISPTVTDLYARFRFQVVSRTGSVDLMRFRNGSGGSKLSLLVDGSTGKLSTRNAAGTTTKSNTVINNGQWYTVEIHGMIGSPSTTEVWLDGILLPELGATGDLGTTSFGQFLLGHTGTTGTYDVVFDDVAVAKNFI